ncbi:MAG: DUF4159 domain-containing protein [Pseudomonadota bacterium]
MLRSARSRWWLIAGLLLAATAAYADREFRVYPSFEAQADDAPLPDDWNKPAGFVVARLMYPSNRNGFGGFGRGRGDWREGGTTWAVDYPRGDRYFAQILRRLTTIDVRSVEQPVNLDDDNDVFDWPYLIVGLPGNWDLTDEQVVKLREYLDRGGFLLADSFFGEREWAGFVAGMKRIFPDREIVDLPDSHPLFHTVYDLDTKHMVPNMNALEGQGVPYRAGGDVPHWRAVLDDNNRVMVAIAFNNDLGDSYQWADDPGYPAEGATLGLRMGVNFVAYALTH